ncbi:MAG: SprB repeat-containing protein [Flavobacteriales bacterium]|nr:SprB repeat-containing protein [Flavobacteriales bacterium]
MKRPLLFTTALFASIAIQALTVTISVVRPSYCGRASGTLIANVSGGVPPYDVQWSNGSTEQYNPGLPSGHVYGGGHRFAIGRGHSGR